MGEEVRSAGPVSTVGGFAGRAPGQQPAPKKGRDANDPNDAMRSPDRVCMHESAADVLRLLRERVLACTRLLLGIDAECAMPEFAEVLDGEPIPAFLGRLLSAQNQLAARCHDLPAPTIRSRCHDALLEGAAETLDLLASNRRADPNAPTTVAQVLAEHARRIAALASNADMPPTQ